MSFFFGREAVALPISHRMDGTRPTKLGDAVPFGFQEGVRMMLDDLPICWKDIFVLEILIRVLYFFPFFLPVSKGPF